MTNNSWTLNNIQPFPSDNPTPRTSFEVSSDEATAVAHRISFSNRVRSIETKYDNEDPIANCIVSSNTKFRIQLYCKSKKSSSSKMNTVLVQAQRRSGCSLAFNKEYKAIVQAAKYGVIVAPKTAITFKATTSRSRIPNSLLVIPIEDGVLERNLENAQTQLLSNAYDEQLFGLEDVASTTNSQLSSDDIVLKASKLIMLDEKYLGIRESISSIIKQNENENSFLPDTKYFRGLALTILANVLSALSRENTLSSYIKDGQWCILSLIPSLIDDMKNALINQHNSSLAAKCLSIFFKDSLEARSQVDRKALAVLESAKCIGKLSHARLERAAQSAMNEIMMEA